MVKAPRTAKRPPAAAVRRVMDLYPRIFFACHTRHVADPKTQNVLSAHQASILDHLDDTDPTTLTGLAAHMGVTPSTMSITVGRLIRDGYVRRTRDRRDARRVRLRLTAAGVRIKEAKTVLDPARVRAMLEHLSPTDRARAIDGLALLADAAQAQMHRKVLYGLRPHRGRRRRDTLIGDRHVEVDTDRSRPADRTDGADRPDRHDDPEGTQSVEPREI